MPSSAEPTGVGPPLRVVREAKLTDLLAGLLADVPADVPAGGVRRDDPRRLEASGVTRAGGRLWVAFDNLRLVAELDPRLRAPDPTARLVPLPADLDDIEDVTHDDATGSFYLVVEGRHTGSGAPMPFVTQFDHTWRRPATKAVDLPLERPNKGVEGLECLWRAGRRHLLALTEGNRGRAGKAGRRYGGGRIHVLTEAADRWRVVDVIALPESLRFHDYSAVSVAGDRLAVVSQESSALWVGRLHPSRWEIVGGSVAYPFPRDGSGNVLYSAIEGVAWLDGRTLVVVSDRASGASGPARDKDESVHLVELPAPS